MQLRFQYTNVEGDTRTVTTNPWCIVAWERQTRKTITTIFDGGLGMEDMLFLSWEATKLEGIVVPPFDVWIKTVTDIRFAGDETNPTKPAVTAG